MSSILVLGAGYIGAAFAELALAEGHEVTLADNWFATEREQLDELAARGAQIETADIRSRADLDRLLATPPARLYLLAAQASRPLAERDPDYTEETNVMGVRRVAEAVVAAGVQATVFASSLHVYGAPRGKIGPDHPYGRQGDLAHLSKVYGELCLSMYAERAGFDLTILRLGIVYGPSPVEHSQVESQTVVDKFRRLAADGEELPLDDGGEATIGVVHVADVARVLLDSPRAEGIIAENVVAESITVRDIAALAHGGQATDSPRATFTSRLPYTHMLADYMAGARPARS